MNKLKKYLFFIPILTLLLVSSFADEIEKFEKGDILFRGPWAPGHAALYWEWITIGDPNNRISHRIIEAIPGEGVHIGHLDVMYGGDHFMGAKTASGISYAQRQKIIEAALTKIGDDFVTWGSSRLPKGYYKGPHTWSCVGFTEYCYEKAGFDLVPKDWLRNWEKCECVSGFLCPLLQYESANLVPDSGVPPTVELADVLQNGEILEPASDIYYVYDFPDISDIVTIQVNVSDGENGSGIRMTDFWVGVPDDTPDVFESNDSGKRIVIDAHKETVKGVYTAEWDIEEEDGFGNPLFPPGEYTLYILTYDQAGNIKSISIEVWKREGVLVPINKCWKVESRSGAYDSDNIDSDYCPPRFNDEVFNIAKSDWNDSSWSSPYDSNIITVSVGMSYDFFCPIWNCYCRCGYGVYACRGVPYCNLTGYDPNQYYAECWYKVYKYSTSHFDDHNSGYEEDKWYKYPEDPVVGTEWEGTTYIPEVNNPPTWNQPFEEWGRYGSYGWCASLKIYLFPK